MKDVRSLMGRIEIVLGPTAELGRGPERIQRVFGIANFSNAGRAPLDFEALAAAILATSATGRRGRSASARSAATSVSR